MPLARARFHRAVGCRCPGSQRALPDSEDPSREAWLGRREPRETGSDRGRPLALPTRSRAQCKDRGARPLPPTSAGTAQVRAGADRLRWHLGAKDGVGPSIPTARGGQGAGVPPLHPFPQPTEGRCPVPNTPPILHPWRDGDPVPTTPFLARLGGRGPDPLPPALPVYSSVLKTARGSPRIQANPSPSAHRARAVRRPGLTA